MKSLVPLTWLSLEPRQRRGQRALQVCIGIALLIRVLTELPFSSYFWGPHGVAEGHKTGGSGLLAATARYVFASEVGTKALLIAVGVLATALLVGRGTRAVPILLAFFVQVLEVRLGELSDGGDNVLRLVLIYMSFMLAPRDRWKPGSLLVWIHNVAVVAIVSQLMLLYLTSGMMKVRGDFWYHGIATYVISGVDWFSLPSSKAMFLNPFITVMTSYVPMFYQVMFPMAVLSRALRLPWIVVGGVFHIGVAVMMGLVTFTTVMLGLELFCLTDDDYQTIKKVTRRAFAAVRMRMGRRSLRRAEDV